MVPFTIMQQEVHLLNSLPSAHRETSGKYTRTLKFCKKENQVASHHELTRT